MLLLGVLLIIVGVQLLSFGLLADLLARTYHIPRQENLHGEDPHRFYGLCVFVFF